MGSEKKKIKIDKMVKQLLKVEEFQKTYKSTHNLHPVANLGEKINNLRFDLMKEENEEYIAAAQQGDLVEVADALGDMLYILCGTIISHGMQYKIEEVFDEIHDSNMSKLDENGMPIFREDGKVLKGSDYFKPNLKDILFRTKSREL